MNLPTFIIGTILVVCIVLAVRRIITHGTCECDCGDCGCGCSSSTKENTNGETPSCCCGGVQLDESKINIPKDL